jgi:hypothetical protein
VSKRLLVGVALWVAAVALTPHEIAAAKAHAKIDARTVVTFACYLGAALLVLSGIRWQPRLGKGLPPG